MIEKFILDSIKNKQPCFFKQAFPKVFSWNELEFLLNFRPFLSTKRFHCPKKDNDYSWKDQAWITDQTTYPSSVVGLCIQNHACYFQDASRVNKKINQICKQLEETFNGDCDAHIFFNLSNNLKEGFGIHHDSSHNLIVQIEGNSEIRVWNKIADTEDNPSIVETMIPGDGVFIPMEMSHCITSLTQRLSISFPINFDSGKEKQDRSWITFGTIA